MQVVQGDDDEELGTPRGRLRARPTITVGCGFDFSTTGVLQERQQLTNITYLAHTQNDGPSMLAPLTSSRCLAWSPGPNFLACRYRMAAPMTSGECKRLAPETARRRSPHAAAGLLLLLLLLRHQGRAGKVPLLVMGLLNRNDISGRRCLRTDSHVAPAIMTLTIMTPLLCNTHAQAGPVDKASQQCRPTQPS